ncbi:MAG: magnesium transporter [Thermoplasmata archaeon]|nr:magnesium transporter [Thermoplasmata archaeon]
MNAWLLKGQRAKDLKESLVSLLFCTFGDLITGVTMGYFTGRLNALPALIILIPPTIDMRGNIFATLASRLGTYLHTGEIVVGKKSNLLGDNINSSFVLTFSMSLYLGILAWIIARYLGMKVGIIDLMLISILAGIFSAFIMVFFTFITTFFSYSKGWNPDNVTAPLITLTGDIVTLPLLFFSMEIVLLLNEETKIIAFLIFLSLSIVISIYSSKSKVAKRILVESIPILIICGLLSSFSGIILGAKFEGIMEAAAILTIVPAFLEDGGAIASILSARFSSALHTGEMKCGEAKKNVLDLFIIVHIIGLIIFPLIGIFGYIAGITMGLKSYGIFKMILISLIAGELLVVIVNILSFYISTISFKIGLNPDNVSIPLLTSLMDFAGTACLIGVALLLNF